MGQKWIALTVNGMRHEVTVGPERMLIDFLRDDLGLRATKQACDRRGRCGPCMVVVNEKTVLSCQQKMEDLQGATVTTVEGDTPTGYVPIGGAS